MFEKPSLKMPEKSGVVGWLTRFGARSVLIWATVAIVGAGAIYMLART